eukprot:314993-Pyramimonas_sp.AAC.1
MMTFVSLTQQATNRPTGRRSVPCSGGRVGCGPGPAGMTSCCRDAVNKDRPARCTTSLPLPRTVGSLRTSLSRARRTQVPTMTSAPASTSALAMAQPKP